MTVKLTNQYCSMTKLELLCRSDGPYSRAVDMAQVRQAYGSVADLYIELFGTSEKVHADDLAFIGRHLASRPGTVLDLGCGPGHITDYLRSLGADATGIDMVPEFIAHAQAAYPGGATDSGRWRASTSPSTPSAASWPGTR